MNNTYRIYYNAEGVITSITVEHQQGNYIVIDEKQVVEVSNHISKYKVIDNKLVNLKKNTLNPPTLQFCTDFDLGKAKECYITAKNNLFLCEQSVTIKPTDFDNTRYSWVKYDS